MMDALAGKLEELRFGHDVEQIDLLVSKLRQSSYVSSSTRSKVVGLVLHKKAKSPSSELDRLEKVFGQPTTNCIKRSDVRTAINFLQTIKQNQVPSTQVDKSTWTKEQWFCHFVDSDSICDPLRDIFVRLHVCRHNVLSSLFTIVVFGDLDEGDFFLNFVNACHADSNLSNMTEAMARSIFKYHGGFSIEGSLDCGHVMAGNDMKSVRDSSSDGNIGGFFKFGDKVISVTAAHVVPNDFDYKVKDLDVAFLDVTNRMKSASNPLYLEPDKSVFEHFQFPEKFPFNPAFLHSLAPGTKIIKLGSRSGLTEGRLLCVAEDVTFYEKTVKHEVKNGVSVAWQSDERFTMPGDSGSVYYAIQGCFRYPIAVHRASVVIKGKSEDWIEMEGGRREKLAIHSRISIGTPLTICLEEYCEIFNPQKVPIDEHTENVTEDEDPQILPEWFDRFEVKT